MVRPHVEPRHGVLPGPHYCERREADDAACRDGRPIIKKAEKKEGE